MNAFLTVGLSAMALSAAVLHAAPQRYDHVVIVIEENRAPGSIIGDLTNAPYINSLAAGGVSLGQMFAIEHPSQPNYFQLFSGDNQGVEDDSLPANFSTTPTATYPFTSPNLAAELEAAGFSFAGFSEALETAGAADWADYDPHSATMPGVHYRRKHNPWANWVAKVSPRPSNQLDSLVNRAFTQFPSDYAQLPTVSIVVPDQLHDMHDGSRKEGDAWLQANLDGYAQWAKTNNSLLVITWDEDDYAKTNQIPTVLYGANLRAGTVAPGTWTHHNMLRTLEDMYGSSTHAGSAALVRPIIGPFIGDPEISVRSFRQGLDGYAGTRDTMVREEFPTTDYSTVHDINVDRDTNSSLAGNQDSQVLVRFENLFGIAAGQVPADAIIHSAKLIMFTPVNSGGSDNQSDDPMRAHRMIMDWSDTATWDNLVDGVAIDGSEAAVDPTFSFVPEVDGAPAIIDVTADVERFQNGTASNHGWLLRPSSSGGGDGWTMKSSESATDVTFRPTLEIDYSLPAVDAYTSWASVAGLVVGNNAPDDDPEHDGAQNLMEFAFNTNPLVSDPEALPPAGTSGNPSIELVAIPGGHAIEITFLRRKAGLSYAAEFSSDLIGWDESSLAPAVTNIDTNWERVTVRDDAGAASARRFVRVRVTLTT